MKPDPVGKPSASSPQAARMAHDPSASRAPIDDTTLRNYLAETLPPEESARVEKAMRDSAELRARLEEVRNNREDLQLHTLGNIWKTNGLSCPSRENLGSFLLDVLDEGHASYIKFHIEVIECPYCRANLTDLERKQAGRSSSTKAREKRILEAIKKTIGEDSGRLP